MQSLPLSANSYNPELDHEAYSEAVREERISLYAPHNIVECSDNMQTYGIGDANVQLYARASYWSPQEIAALSFGKNPTLMAQPEVRTLEIQRKHPICQFYLERCVLALRAVEAGQLFAQTPPWFALAWLNRMKITYPEALRNQVKLLGFQIADWKTECDHLTERVGELTNSFEVASEQYNKDLAAWQADAQNHKQWQAKALDLIGEQESMLLQSNAELEHLKQQAAEVSPDIRAKERNSFLKLILGIALEQYGYNPEATRSTVTATICEDLDNHGLALDLKTIRKILNEAAESYWESGRE